MQERVGRTFDLLVEGESEETPLLWEGRTQWHAPEIDGTVFVNDFGPFEALRPGGFYRCEVTEAHEYDLVARVVGEVFGDGRNVKTEELAGAGVGL